MSGVAMGESPRWHENRLWFSDWGAQEIVAVDSHGTSEVAVRVPFGLPFCIDWLPDGRLLVVSGRQGILLRRERDGSLVTHADLHGSIGMSWNEILVDGRGNVYINGGSGIVLLTPDGFVRQVADSIAFPNGMAITPDNLTLIIAESYDKKLTSFDIAADGSLLHRRVWAALGDGVPDGICMDGDGAVWYADVPNKRCVRVREGGEVLQTVTVDRGCFACMLGGAEKKTLFIIATEWRGMDKIAEVAQEQPGRCSPMRRLQRMSVGRRNKTKVIGKETRSGSWSLLFCLGDKLRIDIDMPARELKFLLPNNKSNLLDCDLVSART